MIDIGSQTGWFDILMSHDAALDRLVAYDARLAKFRGVLNDEAVASELRLIDVSHMTEIPLKILVAVIAGKDPPESQPSAVKMEVQELPWSEPGPGALHLDLRPVFDRGVEPLGHILANVARLEPTDILVIDAPFHPLPLRRLLAGRGFGSAAHQISSLHWQVAFKKLVEDGVASAGVDVEHCP